MKKYIKIVLAIAFFTNTGVFAQVGMMGNNPNVSAVLDMSASTNKGLLIPNVNLTTTTIQTVLAGGAAVQSLLVYNTNTTTGTGYYFWDGSKWVKLAVKADFSTVTDNLGNQIATQALDMSGFNINGAAKTAVQTAAIAKGTDNNTPAKDMIAFAADANGNIVWKPDPTPIINLDPAGKGTVMMLDGVVKFAQEITANMTADFIVPVSGVMTPIGNITNVTFDNMNAYTATADGNSFQVREAGIYNVAILAYVSVPAAGANTIVALTDETGTILAKNDGYIVAASPRNQSVVVSGAVQMQPGKTYTFSIKSLSSTKVKAFNSGSSGAGSAPISFFSVKRIR